MLRMLETAREHLGMDVTWLAEFTDGRMVFRDLDGERDFFGLDVGEGIPLEGSYCRRMVDGEIANLVPRRADRAERPRPRSDP